MMHRNESKFYRAQSAFTLIELLVVISIILIASSIIFIGGNGGAGAKLSSSQRILAGIAQGARGQAILKNAETRLIIHNDPTDPEKYLRFFGVVYLGEDLNSDGTVKATGWKAATQGTYLPEGIYFDPSLSNDYSEDTMNLDYPRKSVGANTDEINGGGSTSYYWYGFKSNGNSLNANQWLALRAGQYNSTGALQAYDANSEQAGLKTALIFRRVGTTTLVDDPTKITE
ncbi:prepilin-type N-terminal cleavage/methylation domain-containing protein [Coraliomargarita sp. SDUM461003]|uniref:Prepilin-type N-terminal cleavage/methylation domain-containing protein n=1 Tax=Thalassobacterium maritimum TaxID=3041265 RepID=A0ABU1AYW5_9BACT|nr:prepilin-type N-terminal cleavage/methylation domain-containing protein [Coraliomargarita sp. SDUM461003]MDQ8209320.1 prepilin-type N-terminal cleavage/methylation domain-containing protein [Coraliomargarita sp. SDUM461003]